MKYPYLLGERSPARAAEELYLVRKYPRFVMKTRDTFHKYLKRYYPEVYQVYLTHWHIECFVLVWDTQQAPFVIAILDTRTSTILAIYPTFKKAARALRAILNMDAQHNSFGLEGVIL